MKKMKRFLLLLFMCCLVSSNVSDESVVKAGDSEDWGYTILEDGTIRIDYYGGSDRHVTIPAVIDNRQVTVIGDNAFSIDCTEVGCICPYSVVIPEGVTTIGEDVFGGCHLLTDISIPESLQNIDHSSFMYTPWFEQKQKESPFVIVNNILIDGNTCTGNIIIPESVTKIAPYAFNISSKIEHVTIPGNVKTIDIAAFQFSSVSNVTILDGVQTISFRAFAGCTQLTAISIPDNITDIGGSVFENTPWLQAQQEKNPFVTLNNVLIDGKNCEGDITIPDNVTKIAPNAFVFNEEFTSVTIPDSVTEIGDFAFSNCYNLKKVIVPSSVTTIGDRAFNNYSAVDDTIVVVAEKGSYAEQYAQENNCAYEYPDGTPGVLTPPTTQEPTTEAPKPETPTTQAPTTEAPKPETPTTQAPTTEAPKPETPTTQAPTTEAPKPETPTTQAPVTDTPKQETPTTQVPTTTTPQPEQPATEQAELPTVTKVKKFKAKAKKNGFTLTWKKVSGAKGYQIQVSTKKNFNGAKTYKIGKNKTKYNLSKLKANKKYYIRICAYKTYKDGSGKTLKIYGKYVKLNKKTKK